VFSHQREPLAARCDELGPLTRLVDAEQNAKRVERVLSPVSHVVAVHEIDVFERGIVRVEHVEVVSVERGMTTDPSIRGRFDNRERVECRFPILSVGAPCERDAERDGGCGQPDAPLGARRA
jgi:hypothetical protein